MAEIDVTRPNYKLLAESARDLHVYVSPGVAQPIDLQLSDLIGRV